MFGQSNITQALGQTTRVGIVTYGKTATVVNLNKNLKKKSLTHDIIFKIMTVLQNYNLTAFNDTGALINAIFAVANKPTTDTESDVYT